MSSCSFHMSLFDRMCIFRCIRPVTILQKTQVSRNEHDPNYKMKHTAIFTCLSITTPHQVGSTSEVKVKQRRSYETCYTPLLNADADNDGRLSEEEYTQYVIDNSDDVASSARGYKDLTFELQIAFVYLDCLCGDGEMGNCCDGKSSFIGILFIHCPLVTHSFVWTLQ